MLIGIDIVYAMLVSLVIKRIRSAGLPFLLGAGLAFPAGVFVQQWLHPTTRIQQNVGKIKNSPGVELDQAIRPGEEKEKKKKETRRERRARERAQKKPGG